LNIQKQPAISSTNDVVYLDTKVSGKKKIYALTSAVNRQVKWFERAIWPWINSTAKLVKYSVQVRKEIHKDLQSKVSSVIAKIGMLSLLSFVLALSNTPRAIKTLFDHIKLFGLTDPEKIVVSTGAILANPATALKALSSLMGTLSTFDGFPEISFFKLIGLPLTIGLLTYGTLMKAYHLVQYGIGRYQMPKQIERDDFSQLEHYLEKAIGPYSENKMDVAKWKESTIKKKKLSNREIAIIRTKNIYSRRTDSKVYAIMLNLQKRLSEKTLTNEEAAQGLNDGKTLMRRKITSQAVGTVATAGLLTTLAVSILTPIAPLAAPIAGVVLAATNLSRLAYQKVCMYHGMDKRFTSLN